MVGVVRQSQWPTSGWLEKVSTSGGGFGGHIRRMNNVYRLAGLHVCALARGASARRAGAVLRDALDLAVDAQDLSKLSIGPDGPAGIMLGYGAVPTARIAEGLRRLRSGFG